MASAAPFAKMNGLGNEIIVAEIESWRVQKWVLQPSAATRTNASR